jgi:predicted Zn-ribbon and HTH transcriptional regulator
MPRNATLAADIENFLRKKKGGATTREICEALDGVRRSEVLAHSVRSALYRHLDPEGERLFVKLGRARYGLRK